MTTTTVEGDQGTNIPHNAEDDDMPKLENPKKNRNAYKTFQKHLREEFLVPSVLNPTSLLSCQYFKTPVFLS